MTETTQNYYYVESDRDLLKLLFDQLPCQSLEDLLQLLDQKHIASFKDILDYASGPDCPNDLALTIEVAMDRLRRTDMRRSSDWASSSKIGNYLANKLLGQKQEQFWVLYFDQQQNLLGEKMLFQGTLDRSWVHPREIFRWAMVYGCASIIVAHNHPSGALTPSDNDLELTKGLKKASKIMKITFLDHFIIGGGEYLSLRERELF
ncbi:JAB domain-containing protein [Lactobacillus delbrueckii subsp. allosunkii]|mgnify:FL=1|uniref:DNA repair protein RadC n=3 Tax=Lactobacillus delbrueckii TaxID=1584 RepID=A0ABD0AEB3_9LACO|nr:MULTISPECIES: JAB domain-containing protein [Lactobacillus]APG74469.1 DNA repair protein RadC [Lactobacillus delbrueckii subsp. sunkii]EFK32735.1 DNA repair protein RadC [Lactobacillus delbrueckii subsp. bulgaricus PB2003/044-T3-4]KNE74705.1 DNA repair protein RadC [Lactobacillus delbrueckii subsp. sunkii]MCD5517019.1 JAB domain-containing protein [Lactobacillus delbrueckii subsp. sunkii]MCT3476667.1 DNA repair protein RadC [Lactobacillus delbrueckii subsp. lactis]